jgi:hypothetical protein
LSTERGCLAEARPSFIRATAIRGFGFAPFFRVLTGRCPARRTAQEKRRGPDGRADPRVGPKKHKATVSLFVAGSVDYRQALLRVVIPFGALAWAYKCTQSQQGGRVAPAGAAH